MILFLERTAIYWQQEIVPEIKAGRRILIATHAGPLRVIITHLEKFDELMRLDIPNGTPFLYKLDEDFQVICLFLFDEVHYLDYNEAQNFS